MSRWGEGMSGTVVNLHGAELRWIDVMRHMDRAILTRLQSLGGYSAGQELFERYAAAHVETFHQPFPPYSGGRS